MAKIKSLVGAPPEFHLPIALKDLDGSDAEVIFKCQGRTLRDWHPLAIKRITDDANAMLEVEEARDGLEAKSDEPAAGAPKRKTKAKRFEVTGEELQQSIDKGLVQTTEIIREVATGWDLDDEFTDANLAQLCSRFPGVHQKLWQAYDARIRGDRLGN
jgi:hypothetical protein